MNSIVLRHSTIEDIPAIQRVGRISRQISYVDTGLITASENEEVLQNAWSVEALTSSMTSPDNHAIVALDKDVVIGYLSGRCKNPLEEGQVRLYRIYLDPNYWGQRIGFTMWHHYRDALDPAVKRIDVGVFASNIRASRFYERLGFRIVNTENGISQLQMKLI